MQQKLTDQQVYQLYVGLGVHYKECTDKKPKMTASAITTELLAGIRASLGARYGVNSLQQLPPEEQMKVYQVLDTFIKASPLFREEPRLWDAFYSELGMGNLTITINNYSGRHHCCNNNSFFTGYWLGSMNRPWWGPGWSFGGHSHGHSSSDKDGSIWAMLALLAVMAAAVAATFVAMYFLLRDTADSVGRFWYNEGWMQATVTLVGMAISGAVASMLAETFVAGPLASLAIAAGVVNPIGIVVLGITCLTFIGAAAGSFITNAFQNYAIKQANADALDPSDPYRFALTPAEARRLEAKGYDPIKVKCAIVALRLEMGEQPALNDLYPDTKVMRCLEKIRKLRKGECESMTVGTMEFDFKATKLPEAYLPTATAVPVPPVAYYSSDDPSIVYVASSIPAQVVAPPAYQGSAARGFFNEQFSQKRNTAPSSVPTAPPGEWGDYAFRRGYAE